MIKQKKAHTFATTTPIKRSPQATDQASHKGVKRVEEKPQKEAGSLSCYCCGQPHKLINCDEFLRKCYYEKRAMVRDKQLVIAPSFFILIICRCWASNTFIFPIFCSNQKKKRLPAASAHFTLLCFSQFQKIIFSRFCTVANYVIAPNYMLFILDFCYLAVGRIFLQEKTSRYFCFILLFRDTFDCFLPR